MEGIFYCLLYIYYLLLGITTNNAYVIGLSKSLIFMYNIFYH